MKEAVFYKKIDSDCVQCLACNHYCKIFEGKSGICGTRQNIKGILYSLVYGISAASHVDPIEKKPFYHFMPNSKVFSIGTVGCNFNCLFCQNWDISQLTKPPHNQVTGIDLTPQEIVDFAKESACPSIAYTYNEPAVFIEYALDTMKLAKKAKIKNIFVSNGYISYEVRQKLKGLLDAANIDLKSFSNRFYRKVCGASLEPVLECIKHLWEMKIHIEITTLVIPGENDKANELKQIAEFIAGIDKNIAWHISRFFPRYKMTEKIATPIKILQKAKKIGIEAGLKNVYIGNV